MATDEEYQKRISSYKRRDLLRLWRQIQNEQAVDWEPGRAFEYLVLRAFQLEGAEVRWPYQVKLSDEIVEQVDGLVHCDGLSCLIECKDQTEPVNIAPIAKLRHQLLRRPVSALGAVFSRSGFTAPVRILAHYLAPQTILLWNEAQFDYALQKRWLRRGLVAKYRFCIAEGSGFYDFREEADNETGLHLR
jgi:hypothetical protein